MAKPKGSGAAATKARIAGEPGDLPVRRYCGGALTLETERRFLVTGARGGAQQTSDESIAADRLVEIELEGGITLWTSFAQLKKDFPTDPASRAAREAGPGTYVFPAALPLGDAARGGLTDWAVKAWNLLSLKLDAEAAAQLAARGVGWLLEHRIDQRQGLHRFALGEENGPERIAKAGQPPKLADIDATRPLLVFLHGTGSSTAGSFAGLWEARNRDLRASLAAAYGETNVLALEHCSVSLSPIRNALDLAQALPQNARLHLVSHSRGGLIGELLARGNRHNVAAFDDTDLAIVSEPDAALLRQLRDVMRDKRLRVERFVRVACPARGTSLASGRLDRYLSVMVNVFKLASLGGRVPLLAELEDFTAFAAAVAQRRSDPSEFPGLEAMMPESRLIRMLNRPGVEVDGDLTVIAGDAEPQGILKRLALLVTDLYFDEEHDFVVNTANMSGGAARGRDAARIFRHKHADVSHFRYFHNVETSRRLAAGLLQPDGFAAGFAHLRVAELPSSRGSRRGPRGPAPAVVVLPGIMGSALAVADGKSVDTVWIDFIDLARGGLCKKLALPDRHRVIAEEPLPRSYGRLLDFLADTHRVVPFAYDWRISLKDEAQRLAGRILMELEQTERDNQPLSILAHSMGGLLARALLAFRPDVWQRVCRHPDARVLMLGTPTRGSHSITRVLAGQENLIKLLATLDLHDSKQEILATVSRFPGVLELLPDARGVDAASGKDSLLEAQVWAALKDSERREFALPGVAALDTARAVRKQLADTHFEAGRLVYVAGRADETPIDFAEMDGELEFSATNQGDGRVPWKTGIPADASAVYYLDAVHGDMTDTPEAFAAIGEILRTGRTASLALQPPAGSRGDARTRAMRRPALQAYPDEESLEVAVRGGAQRRGRPRAQVPRVRLVVRHGDLRYTHNPLVVGHYFGDAIVSAEQVLDQFLDQRLSTRLQLGLYPGQRNTAEVFINPDPAKPSAIVIGLGAVGELSVGALAECFTAGLLRYAAIRAEGGPGADAGTAGVSSLLIGTGGGGLSIDDSLTGLLRGMRRAIDALASSRYASRVNIEELELVELFEDRAIATVHSLQRLAEQVEFRDRFDAPQCIEPSKGGCRRAMFEEPANWWQRLQITAGDDGGLRFVSLTQRARAEARLQALQRPLIDRFLEQARDGTATDDSIGVTLFELLLPNELKQYAPDQSDLVMVVDEESARYPWELLRDRNSQQDQPMVVQRGVLRQLQTTEYRPNPDNCRNKRALVVGDPLSKFIELPGAQKEAEAVAARLEDADAGTGFEVTRVVRENARTILRELMAHDYRIVHLAGHGVFDYPVEENLDAPECEGGKRKPRHISGMVIGDGIFLTPVEVRQMRQVPELVFINCCHLGRVDVAGDERNQWFVPHRLAANLAVEFIRIGVRAVIAAGWEVDDEAARTFAETFYRELLSGRRFGKAVQEARRETWERHRQKNTWGAYQCYGDSDYRLGDMVSRKLGTGKAFYVSSAEARVDLHNLASAVASSEAGRGEGFGGRIADIEARMPGSLRNDNAMAARLGSVYYDVGDFANSLRCYRMAERSELAPRDIERYANAAARRAEQLPEGATVHANGKTHAAGKAAAISTDKPLELADLAIELLEALLRFGPTIERYNLMGSAQKRRALLCTNAGARKDALVRMAFAYASAAHMHDQATGDCDAYAAINAWTALIVLGWYGAKPSKDQPQLQSLRQGLAAIETRASGLARSDDFWARALAGDCALMRLIDLAEPGAAEIGAVVKAYRDAAGLGARPREWDSVLSHIRILKAFADDSGKSRIAMALDRLHGQLSGES